jgi:hypothetical protein
LGLRGQKSVSVKRLGAHISGGICERERNRQTERQSETEREYRVLRRLEHENASVSLGRERAAISQTVRQPKGSAFEVAISHPHVWSRLVVCTRGQSSKRECYQLLINLTANYTNDAKET